jgi:hypothetical protein
MINILAYNESLFVRHTHVGTLDDFMAYDSEKTFKPILNFLNGVSDANMLLIPSDICNGGKYLLSGLDNAMLDNGEVIMCMSSEMVLRQMAVRPEETR